MSLIYIFDVDKSKIISEINENIIILSPSFYWYKICEIPTNNLSKASNIAKHMMSDGHEKFQDISLQKLNNNYAVYKYDNSIIKAILSSLKIKEAKIYFSDQLNISDKVAIDEDNYLFNFNNKIIELNNPNEKINPSIKDTYLSLIDNSKPIINLQKNSKKNSAFFALSTAILFVYIILFGFDKVTVLSNINDKKTDLSTEGKSSYEIRSLIKKYKKLEKNSSLMQKDISKSLVQKDIKMIEYKNQKIKVVNK